jgi:hypothetical protein
MKAKQVIFLIITIVALGAAGVFGYFVLTDTTAPVETTEATLEILPQGTDLNFSPVKDFNKTGKLFRYPEVSPSEIKVELNDLMLPAPAAN